jgi:hypothetical protein
MFYATTQTDLIVFEKRASLICETILKKENTVGML